MVEENHPYSWYVCEHDHIYVVNNCGEPLELGTCFCGSPIGGEKHTMVRGNKRLTDYKFKEDVSFYSFFRSSRNIFVVRDCFAANLMRAVEPFT